MVISVQTWCLLVVLRCPVISHESTYYCLHHVRIVTSLNFLNRVYEYCYKALCYKVIYININAFVTILTCTTPRIGIPAFEAYCVLTVFIISQNVLGVHQLFCLMMFNA